MKGVEEQSQVGANLVGIGPTFLPNRDAPGSNSASRHIDSKVVLDIRIHGCASSSTDLLFLSGVDDCCAGAGSGGVCKTARGELEMMHSSGHSVPCMVRRSRRRTGNALVKQDVSRADTQSRIHIPLCIRYV